MEMKICKNPNCKYINPQPIDNFRLTSKGYRGKCKECEREYSKEYSRKNAKLRAEKQRKYYEEHGEIQKEASRKWKENNKEHISQYNKKWYDDHKESRKQYNHKYGQEHHDGVLERSRKSRAIAFGKHEHFTEEEFREKASQYGNKCFYCGIELNETNITRDHYIPLTLGGGDTIDNIVPCCNNCNSKKRNMLPSEYIMKLGNHEPSQTNGE